MSQVERERSTEEILKLHDYKKTRNVILLFLNANEQLAHHTKELHIGTFHQFFETCKIDYDQVTAKEIKAWLSSLEDQRYKKNTIFTKLRYLKNLYRYCSEERLISEDQISPIINQTWYRVKQKATDDRMWQRYELEKTKNIIQHYLKDSEQGFVEMTNYVYRITYHQFFENCKIDYDQVTAKNVSAWLLKLEEQGYKKSSINVKRIALGSFYRYCLEKSLISVDPTSTIFKKSRYKVNERTKDDRMWQRYDLGRTRTVILHYLLDNERRLVKHTIDTYLLSYQQFFEACKLDYDEVTAKDIWAWLSTLNDQGYKISTLRFKLMSLKSFYLYCMEEGLLSKNPTLTIPLPTIRDYENSIVKFIEKSTVTSLMELTRGKLMEQAIIATLYATGVRISELVHIQLADIDWDSRRILIRQGKGKKDRFVLFTIECAERLKAYTSTHGGPYLFSVSRNRPLSSEWVRKRFRGYTLALKVDHPITPHTLRHTFASRLAQKKMPLEGIQELLGHEDIRTTQYYAQLNSIATKSQYDYYQ